MIAFKSILVDVDASAPSHPALDQAADLARRCGAALTIVDVVPEFPRSRRGLPPDIEEDVLTHRGERLAAIRGLDGLQVARKMLRGRPALALIREVLASGHDLLVRSHARDLESSEAGGFGAVDMALFRKCPCPVWAVGPSEFERPRRLLAAVHATPDDAEEQKLNVKIIELALRMAELEAARLVLLQAWAPFGIEMVQGRYSKEELEDYVEGARRTASEDLRALAGAFGQRLTGAGVEAIRGSAQDVIPTYAAAHDIDLVVMGTVARTGISGLVIGNTAEQLLRRLRCSVLAVKPDGFACPVSLE